MTCRWPAREPCERNPEPGAQGSQLQGDVGRSLLPPIFRSKPGQRDARIFVEKEKPRFTRGVKPGNGIGLVINVSQDSWRRNGNISDENTNLWTGTSQQGTGRWPEKETEES